MLDGFSSYLYLDLKNVGCHSTLNQLYEQVYNVQMPELIFGRCGLSAEATKKQFKPGSITI